MNILQAISSYLQNGDATLVMECVQIALDNGFTAEEVLKSGLLPGIEIVGEKFRNNEVYIPHILLAARAMNAGLEIIRPRLGDAVNEFLGGRALIGTVKGDLHDLGKNMVKAMLEKVGFDVYDLGRDIPKEEFVVAAREYQPHLVGLSASMTTTLTEVGEVIKALEEANLREKMLIMIGGLPVTDTYAKEVGADICCIDVDEAASQAKKKFLTLIGHIPEQVY